MAWGRSYCKHELYVQRNTDEMSKRNLRKKEQKKILCETYCHITSSYNLYSTQQYYIFINVISSLTNDYTQQESNINR